MNRKIDGQHRELNADGYGMLPCNEWGACSADRQSAPAKNPSSCRG